MNKFFEKHNMSQEDRKSESPYINDRNRNKKQILLIKTKTVPESFLGEFFQNVKKKKNSNLIEKGEHVPIHFLRLVYP